MTRADRRKMHGPYPWLVFIPSLLAWAFTIWVAFRR